jgi:hypothetical protein
VRELLTRGLATEGFVQSEAGMRSKDYGVSEANDANGSGAAEGA